MLMQVGDGESAGQSIDGIVVGEIMASPRAFSLNIARTVVHMLRIPLASTHKAKSKQALLPHSNCYLMCLYTAHQATVVDGSCTSNTGNARSRSNTYIISSDRRESNEYIFIRLTAILLRLPHLALGLLLTRCKRQHVDGMCVQATSTHSTAAGQKSFKNRSRIVQGRVSTTCGGGFCGGVLTEYPPRRVEGTTAS